MTGLNRLDGWKAISSHFGRDRTTVMRWARDRSLPIHRVPGGSSSSVFAYASELDAWSVSAIDQVVAIEAEESAQSGIDKAELRPKSWRSSVWVKLLVAIVLSAAVGFAVGWRSAPPLSLDAVGMRNENPSIRRDFLRARDLWGRRTGDDIKQSIELYNSIIAQSPDFAAAHAGLAEAWLIYREYGATTEAEAYRNAKPAIDRALALDPNLPAGHRAKGFLAYWWSNDSETAEASFRRSISLDDRDPTTRFWFANILSDQGRHTEAEEQFDAARYLLPGFRPLEVEQACALWQAGRDAEAMASLQSLVRRYPDDATIHNCLAWASISRGDIDAFVGHFQAMATIRGEPSLVAQAQRLTSAHARNPATAHRTLIAGLRQEFANGQRQTRMTPAFYASSMGDREELLGLLNEAINLNETWQSRNLVDRIGRRWRGDPIIVAALRRLDIRPSPASISD